MLNKDLEKAVIQAKKTLNEEEVKGVLEKCSYGGEPIEMDLKEGKKLGYSTSKRIY